MAKENSNNGKWKLLISIAGILVVIVLAMLGFAQNYSEQNSKQDVKIETNGEKIDTISEKVDSNSESINKLQINFAEQKKDIEYIKKGQDETNRSLRRILRKMGDDNNG